MALIYQHRRNDTNEIFYIGVGKSRDRAGRRANRNPHWHNIDKKYGFTWEILITGLSMNEAFSIEKGLISYYGRRDLKTGNLVNQTRGGEGRTSQDREEYSDYFNKTELREHIMKYHPRK